MSRNSARNPRLLLAAALAAGVGLLSITIALGGESVRRAVPPSHHPHLHSHTESLARFVLGREAKVSPVEAGSTLVGGKTITYSDGGAETKTLRGTAGGRTIYTGTAGFEPTIGIDKKNNVFYQGAQLFPKDDFGVWAPIVVVSRDGGRSWNDVTPPTHPHTADPMLYVDTRTGRAFTADVTFPCTRVSHTDDVGRSWTTSEGCGITDHQTVFAGPPVSSPTVGYPNVVYMCAMDLVATSVAATATSCLKSLDGGITWVRTGTPAYIDDPRAGEGQFGVPGNCGGGTGHGFVDRKGIVYLPRGWCEQPYLAISKDEGATWERIQVARSGMARGVRLNLCAGACTGDLHFFEHEAAVAADRKGNIYYFWVARDRLPYLAVSSNGGRSFSKPVLVGPPGLKEAWGPKIDIGDTGKIALAYVGSSNAPGGRSPDGVGEEYTDSVTWNGYITTSVDALSKRPRFFTATVNPSSDPIVRGECAVGACGAQADFIDVAIGPDGRPWTSMVDGCPPPGDVCGRIGQGFVGTVVGGPKLR